MANKVLNKDGLGLTGLSTSSIQAASQALASFVTDMSSDDQYVNGLKSVVAQGKKAYMATVSPWFFTHYGPDSFNKNVSVLLDSDELERN